MGIQKMITKKKTGIVHRIDFPPLNVLTISAIIQTPSYNPWPVVAHISWRYHGLLTNSTSPNRSTSSLDLNEPSTSCVGMQKVIWNQYLKAYTFFVWLEWEWSSEKPEPVNSELRLSSISFFLCNPGETWKT